MDGEMLRTCRTCGDRARAETQTNRQIDLHACKFTLDRIADLLFFSALMHSFFFIEN